MTSPSSGNSTQQHHFDVDYVIRYRFKDTDLTQATQQLERLLHSLAKIGLEVEVRQGDESSLLVFVRAYDKSLGTAVYRSRVRDWLYGVRNDEPERSRCVEPKTEAERLRVINDMITLPKEQGGAGITPNHGEWKNVTAIFPLHDEATNRQWMRDWSKKTFLSAEDLDQIRNRFGESVGFYFAFLQSYFKFLVFPALFGFFCWFFLGYYSIIYTVVNCLWGVVFIEYWKRKESDLSCRWQTKGVSAVLTKRREFKPEKEVRDATTGEIRGVFPASKRICRQLLQVPFALLSAVALGVIIATCFAIEIFISEVYSGPFKTYLVFIPTILVSSLVPTMSAVLTSIATKLNDYENYETRDAYDVALTRKIFVINFITSYLPIFLTAFVYVPFASLIVPYLDVFQLTVRPFVSKEQATVVQPEFRIDPARLRNQVIYFTVTAQIVGFAMETIVPFLKQNLFRKYKAYTESGEKRGPTAVLDGTPEEVQFLSRVRNEAELPEYNVTDDLREMCIQFGYLALFSPTWPLVPVSFLINNWVELRSDFFKICVECRRPVPLRTDTIGPWLDSLGLLSWIGSITSAALVHMFSNGHPGPNGEPSAIRGWALLLTIFFSEHLYIIVRYAVRAAMAKLEPPNAREERAERYRIRKRFLDSALKEGSDKDQDSVAEAEGKSLAEQHPAITRVSLEDNARVSSLDNKDPVELFWMRQKGWMGSAAAGAGIIQAQASRADVKKVQ